MADENVYRSTKAASQLARGLQANTDSFEALSRAVRALQASTKIYSPEAASQMTRALQASTLTDSLENTRRILREALPSTGILASNVRIAQGLERQLTWSDDEKPASTKPELEKGTKDKRGLLDKWDLLFSHTRKWPDKWPVSREEARLVMKLRGEGVPGERGPRYGRDAVCEAARSKTNGWLSAYKVRWVFENFPLRKA